MAPRMGADRTENPDGVDPARYGDRIADVYDEWFPGAAGREEPETMAEVLAGLAGSGPALELGVGTGRVALLLAARGVPVSGIDASGRMVARMRAKPGGDTVPVAVGDFVDVAAPGGPFSVVYVVFNTFFVLLSQDDQIRCFANVARRLRPGGVFVVEAFRPDPTQFDRGQRVNVAALDGDEFRLSAAVHDWATQRVRARTVSVTEGGVRIYPVELRYAWPSELDLMARLAGMTLVSRHGGWRGEPFTAGSPTHVSVWRVAGG